MDDLVQVGSVGLIKAVDRFNPDLQIEFSTYATPNIVGEIKHHFRDRGWTLKVSRKEQELRQSVRDVIREETASTGCAPSSQEVSEIMGIDVAEVYEALLLNGAHTPDSLNGPASLDDSEGYTLIDVQEDESTPLQDVIGTLDQKHQEVLNLRFTEGRTKAEIARSMGVRQSDVPQLLQGAIEEVRSRAHCEPEVCSKLARAKSSPAPQVIQAAARPAAPISSPGRTPDGEIGAAPTNEKGTR